MQPSFTTEWGIRVFEESGDYRLFMAQFRKSVWYSAYREIRPGHFSRDPKAPTPELAIKEVALGAKAARMLEQVVTHAIDGARASNERMGSDGEIYTFRDTHGHCATTWSPELGTRARALVDVFESLKIQSMLYSRPIQFAREQVVKQQLRRISGEPMTTKQSMEMAMALGVVALVVSLPMLVAAVTLAFPRRPIRKLAFVIWSGIVSYGVTGLLGVVLMPLIVTGGGAFAFMIPIQPIGGDAILARILDSAAGSLALGWLLLSVITPIYLRHHGWARWGDRPVADNG